MKIYISADIEGVAGVTAWEETEAGGRGYEEAAALMTAEVGAACEAAKAAGASEILVKDAHDTGRNIDHSQLPDYVRLYRGWSGHPRIMLEGLDESFGGVIFLGYHSAAGSGGSPLAHTMNTGLDQVMLNGLLCDELLLHAWLARHLGVRPLAVTGDRELCDLAAERFPGMTAVAVKEGIGNGTVSLHPEAAIREIKRGIGEAMGAAAVKEDDRLRLPEDFRLEIRYREQHLAYKNSFYPGCRLQDPRTVVFETDDYGEIMRCANFIM